MPELNTDPRLLEKAMGAMNLKRTALENSILESRIRTMPKEMNYLQKTRDIELKKGQQEVDTGALAFKFQQDMDQPTREKAFMDYLAKAAKDLSLPAYTQGGYDHLLETAKGLGVGEYARQILPPPGDIPAMAMADNQTPEKWWDARREKATTTYAERTARMTAEAHKTTAEKGREKTYEQKTIYGPNGATMNVPIEKGTAYAPPAGWSLNEPPKEGANQTREQLTARSLRGDKEATAILDAMDKREKDIAAVRGNASEVRANRQFAVTLRKEFNALPEVKEYNQTVPKIKSMQAAYELSKTTKNFVAVDQALITLFNKLTDPQSVVRESEYARTAENIPLINQIRGKAEKVMKGGAGLTAEERKGLMDMANLMQKGYDDIRQRRMNEYRGYGTAGGLDPNFLVDANTNSPADVMDKLRKANPGVSDADLRAYAKKKGYL